MAATSRMLLLSPISATKLAINDSLRRPNKLIVKKIVSMAKESSDSSSIVEKAAIVGGLISTPVIGWSLYTLKTTGCGLPSGPAGSIGALEGFSYLSLVAILVVFGLQYLDQGYIPGPLPADQCFG
ncbi:hypothetical protein PIB30_007187 [Stylosanthes scabra]|uniref:Uncharacterized protein n=1 Tax=Stylosanthes scabra TaxID=79078 RepID=A0ABU6U649_9FABA|nr:hypothetical protein [Stylosanthes scabra]